MIRSKFITVIACIALMLTALTGCGGGNTSSTDNSSGSNDSVSNEQVDARQKYVDDNIRRDSYVLKNSKGTDTGVYLNCINDYAYISTNSVNSSGSVKGGITKASEFDDYCETINNIHNNDDLQNAENQNNKK